MVTDNRYIINYESLNKILVWIELVTKKCSRRIQTVFIVSLLYLFGCFKCLIDILY